MTNNTHRLHKCTASVQSPKKITSRVSGLPFSHIDLQFCELGSKGADISIGDQWSEWCR